MKNKAIWSEEQENVLFRARQQTEITKKKKLVMLLCTISDHKVHSCTLEFTQ